MPTITPSLVPTISPGNIFSALTGGDTTLNIRWLVATDPAYYEVINRPIADVTLRQLIIAKAIDNLQVKLGHQNNFPYITQPTVASSTLEVEVPIGLIFDMHASLPKKWENLRLAKIKRIAGENSSTDGYSGWLRLIFTANTEDSLVEVAIFYADYQIDSQLTYQTSRLQVVTSTEESVVINSGESETVAGFIIFQTLDTSEAIVQDFYNLLAPPDSPVDANSDNIYDNPTIYEITDNVAGGINVTDDVSTSIISHGSGLLTDSAWNAIPTLDSDIQSWINSFNYPFAVDATLTSVDGITIPVGMFKEFSITAPAGDQPTGDISGTYYPVWISRIERVVADTELKIYFGTYNVIDSEIGGTPSTETIEFAYMTLNRSGVENDIIEIVPNTNLQGISGTSADEAGQHFGRGHVVLSQLWTGTATEIDSFFASFNTILTTPADTEFTISATRLSSFAVSRVPKYIPTIGQSYALQGSAQRRSVPIYPSDDNRYITEQDEGIGDQIDLESETGIIAHSAIDRYGYTGGRSQRCFKLVIDQSKVSDSDSTFYTNYVLPRLVLLLGRSPVFGDTWYDGIRFRTYNGDAWIG